MRDHPVLTGAVVNHLHKTVKQLQHRVKFVETERDAVLKGLTDFGMPASSRGPNPYPYPCP